MTERRAEPIDLTRKQMTKEDTRPVGTPEDHRRLTVIRAYTRALGEGSPYYTSMAMTQIAITLSNIFRLPPEGVVFHPVPTEHLTQPAMIKHIDRELDWLSDYMDEEQLFTLANHINTVITA